MQYTSTRGQCSPASLSFALAAGLAPDGGLYVPALLPQRELAEFDGATTLVAVTERLLAPFFEGDPLAASLSDIVTEAFDFDLELRALRSPSTYSLELFHGPTSAFKDFGARFLAACLARIAHQATLTVLVATSGDTGSAVASAFHHRPGFQVAVLYPDGLVSPRQAHQLGAFGDNVFAFRVAGTFDDCQRMVKEALVDPKLAESVHLTSANSISLGRLLPQMAYYAWASLVHWRAHGTALGFVIPTGNLGNALAAILCRAMGLPIAEIVLATNANRVLADFFSGEAYTSRPSIATVANAMDVGSPSNFERLRWLVPDEATLRAAFRVEVSDDERLRDSIVQAAESEG
ncbi:threonine synthase, partial [bacterium]